MDIIAGTAGHIDHGKTALVKALTGTDADRLPEEKQRGITIDLGFAELDLGDARIGFVDVPGHERFIKNMLAGVGGIDVVILVIAADEGVMPQTREHFEICRLLDIRAGLIVLTKSDLVDNELLEIVRLEVVELVGGSFLEGAPVIHASARSGEGIEEIKSALRDLARKIPERMNETVARIPLDRSFTVKGFGAVATGTLISGEIAAVDEMELLPQGKKVRVRGVQTHGKIVERVRAGQRAAVNLAGVDHHEIVRGMVLAERNVLRPTQMLDAEIEVLGDAPRAIRSRQRVRVHIGTVEALARVQVLNDAREIAPGAKDLVQLRLEIPVAAIPGDRFIIRSYSPQATIAGGRILDAFPKRHRKRDIRVVREFLQGLIASGTDRHAVVKLLLGNAGASGLTFADLQARTGWRKEILEKALAGNGFATAGNYYLTAREFDLHKSKTLAEIEAHHKREPLAKGVGREALREMVFAHLPDDIFQSVMTATEAEGKIAREGDTVRIASHGVELAGDDKLVYERLRKIYADAGFEVPKLEEALTSSIGGTKLQIPNSRKIFQLLLDAGELVKVSEEFYFARGAIDDLVDKMKALAAVTSDRLIDVPKFKEIAGISRKYAIPLLEYFDRERVTRRAGDKRLIL
jgi:selenocysteine-specific elongation factor